MDKGRVSLQERVASVACGVVALCVYLATLSAGAFPGESARMVAESVGLLPRLVPDYPLWTACSRGLAALGGKHAVLLLNVFSAVCGALAVGFLCSLVTRILRQVIEPANVGARAARLAPLLAGIAAALFLMFAPPFWVVSNRFHTLAFHMALFLAIASVFATWVESDDRRWLYAWAFLYGVGIVEYAGFIPFVPLFAGVVIYLLWAREEIRWFRVVAVGLLALSGMLLYVVSAWQFYGGTGYELREYSNWFEILWYWWQGQFLTIKGSLPSVGWLTILCLTVVPWVTMLVTARSALNRTQEKSLHVLQLVMTALVIIVLLDLKISPWRMLGFGRLLVMPYVLTASLFGYLVAYWCMMPRSWDDATDDDGKAGWKDGVGCAVAGGLMIFAVAVAFVRVGETNGRPAGFVNGLARNVITAAVGKQWVASDGLMDTHLMLAIRDLGSPVKLISYGGGQNKVYANLLSREFTEPRWRNLLELGVPVFVQEWLRSDPSLGRKVCVVGDANLWVGVGLSPVPDGFGFIGVSSPSDVDMAELAARNIRLWEGCDWKRVEALSPRNPVSFYGHYMQRHTALLANNLGVVLEDLECKEDAFRAYGLARRIDVENVSALLNQSAMLDRGYATPDAQAIRDDLKAFSVKAKGGRYHIWNLSRYNGYVRLPEAYLQTGWTWALSGMPGVAVNGLRKAVDLASGEQRRQAEQMLAYTYSMMPRGEETQAQLESLVRSDPSNAVAMVALARNAARKGDMALAGSLLEKAEQVSGKKGSLAMEWVGIHLAAGAFDKARVVLEEIVARESGNLRAWLTLASIHIKQGDEKGLARCLDNLERQQRGGGYVALVRSEIAARNKDMVAFRRHLETALRAMPGSMLILDQLLNLDVAERKVDLAKTHSMEILRINRNHATANYILGTIRIKENKPDLAEELFRASLVAKRTPAVLNDLAWLLQGRGEYKEGELLAREAVQVAPEMVNAWDTLAVILMKMGKLTEAESIFEAQLSKAEAEGVMGLFLHLAELRYQQKRYEKARELVKLLDARRNGLALEDQVGLDALRLQLAAAGQ